MATKYVKILSIDGGGIRGIIPAVVMAEIERRTGKPMCELFDYIAGTSTGGVLALGLTKPQVDPKTKRLKKKPQFSAEDGLNLYKEEGHRIFARSPWRRVFTVSGIVDERYPSAGVEGVLNQYFGGVELKDSLTEVLITAYEIERRTPWFFRSARAKKDANYNFTFPQVARATSAAPTYFEPIKIDVDGSPEYYALIDGGVFANNPTLCAFVDMKIAHPEPETDFLVVSLGTGGATRPIPYPDAKDWGMIQWVQPILNVLMAGVSETVDYQMRQLLPHIEGSMPRYYRFQTRLSEGNDDMDDISRTNMRVLQLVAEEMIHRESEKLDRLCKDLLSC